MTHVRVELWSRTHQIDSCSAFLCSYLNPFYLFSSGQSAIISDINLLLLFTLFNWGWLTTLWPVRHVDKSPSSPTGSRKAPAPGVFTSRLYLGVDISVHFFHSFSHSLQSQPFILAHKQIILFSLLTCSTCSTDTSSFFWGGWLLAPASFQHLDDIYLFSLSPTCSQSRHKDGVWETEYN